MTVLRNQTSLGTTYIWWVSTDLLQQPINLNLTQLKGVESQYSMLKERLEAKYLRNSAYATVMLSKLFEGLPREDLRANKKGDRDNSLVAASA